MMIEKKIHEREILQSEVETTLYRVKDRKASGPDGITEEFLKALHIEMSAY